MFFVFVEPRGPALGAFLWFALVHMSTWDLCCLCFNNGLAMARHVVVLLDLSSRRSCTMELEIPGCDEGLISNIEEP